MRIGFVLLLVGCLRGGAVPDGSATTPQPDPTCPAGFELVDGGCTDVDECLDAPCSDDASCINQDGGFDCICDLGFEGDGFECSDVDGCASAPCGEAGDLGATCTDVPAPGVGHACACTNTFAVANDTCEPCTSTLPALTVGGPTVSCEGAGDCARQTVNCPDNGDCFVSCEDPQTCNDLTVDCAGNSDVDCLTACRASSCEGLQIHGERADVRLVCGELACVDAVVACPTGEGSCQVVCNGEDSCQGLTLTCADGPCHLDCASVGACLGASMGCGSGGCSITGAEAGNVRRTCPDEGCVCIDPSPAD